MKRASCWSLILSIVCTLLCGCAYQRPEFDEVRITYESQDGGQLGHTSAPLGEVVKKTMDPTVMDELWNIYADLEVTNSNPPQGRPRYRIEFLNRGEVVDHWMISSNFVVNGKRFGLGNRVIKGTKLDSPEFVGDSTIYNRITEIFESCDTETAE